MLNHASAAVLAAVAAAPDTALLGSPWAAALAGVAVALLSASVAWGGLRLCARRPGLLLPAVLGGTLLRLLLVGSASAVLLLHGGVHVVGYVTGLVAAYLAFLAVEVACLARRQGQSGGEPPAGR